MMPHPDDVGPDPTDESHNSVVEIRFQDGSTAEIIAPRDGSTWVRRRRSPDDIWGPLERVS